jgi:hypothetical protein
MGDRAYARFTVPTAAIDTAEKRIALCDAFGIGADILAAAETAGPQPGESSGDDAISVRLIGSCPVLVIEDSDCNYGGGPIEEALRQADIPYIQANARGCEYGASSTVFDGRECETIRLDDDFHPIVGVAFDNEDATVDEDELADCARYRRLCQAVLGRCSPTAPPVVAS